MGYHKYYRGLSETLLVTKQYAKKYLSNRKLKENYSQSQSAQQESTTGSVVRSL